MKISVSISLAMLALGLTVMSVTTRQIPLGPLPEIEHDTLKLSRVLWSEKTDVLILLRDGMWTKVDLRTASLTNKQFKYHALPLPGNSFTIADFHTGAPDENALEGFTEVPLMTQEYASFAYKWNGEAWHDHSHKVVPPAPFAVGLYRSQGHYAQDNRTFWGSYIFATSTRRADGRFGIEVFYYPGTSIRYYWHAPRLFPYGPSLLAVCLLVYCMQMPIRALGVTLIALVALGLHSYSSMVLFWVVGYGEAWSGQGPEHGLPAAFAATGFAIIVPLVLLRYATIKTDRIG